MKLRTDYKEIGELLAGKLSNYSSFCARMINHRTSRSMWFLCVRRYGFSLDFQRKTLPFRIESVYPQLHLCLMF